MQLTFYFVAQVMIGIFYNKKLFLKLKQFQLSKQSTKCIVHKYTQNKAVIS